MLATHTQIRAFNAVARNGSFAGAAERLHLTQPAITLQVHALEDTYGVLLFDRGGTLVSITPLGRKLYALTEQIQTVEEQVDELLSAQVQLVKGELTISSGSIPVLMNLVREFGNHYPDIRVSVMQGNWDQVWESIIDRTADIALLTAAPRDARILSVPYLTQHVVALVPAGHQLSRRSSIKIRELVKERLIVRNDKSHTQKLVHRIFRDAGITLQPALSLDTREALQEAVAAGLGIGFVLNEEVGVDDRVCVLEIADSKITCLDAVVCLKGQARRRIVKAFLEVAQDLRPSEVLTR